MDADRITVARKRLEQAVGLSAVLGAACDAFEDMLLALEDLQDPAGGTFAAFMMSGASAASGRDAVAAAPSLPPPSPADARWSRQDGTGPPAPDLLPPSATVGDAAADLAGLSRVLTGRLAEAQALAVDAGDRRACAEASRYAAEICSLLGPQQPSGPAGRRRLHPRDRGARRIVSPWEGAV
jgi:hypothetical protein